MFAVTDVELKRLRDAFKRTSGLSVYMTQQCFYREVLGDGVPPKVAEVSQALIKKMYISVRSLHVVTGLCLFGLSP